MARKPKATDDSIDTSAAADGIDRDLMAMVDATDPATQAPEPEVAPEAKPETKPATMPEPERKPDPQPAPVASASRKSGGGVVLGMILGAVIAAGAGVGVVRYAPQLLGQAQTAADPAAAQALTDLQAQVAALSARLDALPAADASLPDRVTALEQAAPPDTAALQARLDELAARIDALPAPAAGAAPATADLQALRDQIAALQSGAVVSDKANALAAEAEQRLTEARDAAAALTAATQTATAATLRQAALGRIGAALETGVPYAAALADLGEVPPVLADNAATGLPALTALQASFPYAARRGLEAAITADMGASWTERVTNFLRTQTGARSLTPREGDDPDAILSRAEAALAKGDVAAALAEVATLPDPAKAAMADWTAQADLRQQAVQALTALASQG
ncbi:MAG: hypothetical protein CFE34_02175 [Rhodobacteraceae bacterium PARR1]|nr:MAG: hypothetical protein CFE34_02175 [Rhodobacteraceae bacterium PARR1]